MFETTIPFGEPELHSAKDYRRHLKAMARGIVSSRIASLSPSLRADLSRFEAEGRAPDLLEVLAACVRHGQRLTIQLQVGRHAVPLTVFARERLLHCPLPFERLRTAACEGPEVLHVEPALLCPPGDPGGGLVGQDAHHAPLAPLLWALALDGPRTAPLPEIAGRALYRVAAGAALGEPATQPAIVEAIGQLRRAGATLREMSEWPGLGRAGAVRLLHALYLQGALIVSRTHPDAANDSRLGGLR